MEKQSEKPGLAFSVYLRELMDDRHIGEKQMAKEFGISLFFLESCVLTGDVIPGKSTLYKGIKCLRLNQDKRLKLLALAGDERALEELKKGEVSIPDPASEPEPALLPKPLPKSNQDLAKLFSALRLPVSRLLGILKIREKQLASVSAILEVQPSLAPAFQPEPVLIEKPPGKKRGRKPKPKPDLASKSQPESVVLLAERSLAGLTDAERCALLVLELQQADMAALQRKPLGPRKKPVPDPLPEKKKKPADEEESILPPREWNELYQKSKKELLVNGTKKAVISRTKELRSGEQDLHRSFSCVNYEKCLDLAARAKHGKKNKSNWSGFSCQKCPYFKDPAINQDRDSREVEFGGPDFSMC